MRCYCCNKILTPQQATRRFAASLAFTDMCDGCLNTIDLEVVDGEGYEEEHTSETEDDSPE